MPSRESELVRSSSFNKNEQQRGKWLKPCVQVLTLCKIIFQVLVRVSVVCRGLLRGADCSACADDHSGPWIADPASISTISEPRKTTKICLLKSEGLAQTKTRWSSVWTCKPTFQSKDVCNLGPSLAAQPCAACQMDQFRVFFCKSMPRRILLLGLLVIPEAARGTRVLQFDKKSGANHTSFNHQRSTKSPESNAKMYVNQTRDEMARTWKHILRHEHFRVKYRYVGVFSNAVFNHFQLENFSQTNRNRLVGTPRAHFRQKLKIDK